jgi:hypothetical protein
MSHSTEATVSLIFVRLGNVTYLVASEALGKGVLLTEEPSVFELPIMK